MRLYKCALHEEAPKWWYHHMHMAKAMEDGLSESGRSLCTWDESVGWLLQATRSASSYQSECFPIAHSIETHIRVYVHAQHIHTSHRLHNAMPNTSNDTYAEIHTLMDEYMNVTNGLLTAVYDQCRKRRWWINRSNWEECRSLKNVQRAEHQIVA